jgi:putative acetyltransferase
VIRRYRESDLEAVLACFGRAVREIGARYYAGEEIAAWAPGSPDVGAWVNRLGTGGAFVAEVSGAIAGFVRVEDTGFVDLLYVHPKYERSGIARQLFEVACSWAVSHGARRFESEVSLAARPFFEAMGFRLVREQSIERKGVSLQNFRMARDTDAEQKHAPTHQQPASPTVTRRWCAAFSVTDLD